MLVPVSPGIVAALLSLQLPGAGAPESRSPDLQPPLPRSRPRMLVLEGHFECSTVKSSVVSTNYKSPWAGFHIIVLSTVCAMCMCMLFDENRKCWLCSALTLFSINFLDFPYQVATEVKSSLILNFPRKHYLVLQLQQHMRIMESLQTDHGKSIFHISTLI